MPRADLEAGSWLNVALGLLILAVTLLSGGLTPLLLWGNVAAGVAILALSAYEASRWGALGRARLVGLSAASAVIGVALVLLWASSAESLSLRRILFVLGALVVAVGAYGAWSLRARAPAPAAA